MNSNVVIVGSGLAGLVAGICCLKSGKQVLILEKQSSFGGNSIKASSGINLINSTVQQQEGIDDMENIFMRDTLSSANCGTYDRQLIYNLCQYSKKVERLLKEMGVTLDSVSKCAGHKIARTHFSSQHAGVGYYLTKTAHDYYIDLGGAILYNKSVKRLIKDDYGRVIGVEANNHYTYHGSVILATGGYERSNEYLSMCDNRLCSRCTTAGDHCTGDGLRISRQIGAQLVGMNYTQLHPTGIIDPNDINNKTKFLAPEALRAEGGKLYSFDGSYIGSELENRDVLSSIIDRQSNGKAILIIDKTTRSKLSKMIDFYLSKGLCKEEGDVVVFYVTPVIHYTMGGLRINTNSQVIDTSGKIIQGLYAAGEVTGGIHGTNRLAGNSVLECCVYGMIAAENV